MEAVALPDRHLDLVVDGLDPVVGDAKLNRAKDAPTLAPRLAGELHELRDAAAARPTPASGRTRRRPRREARGRPPAAPPSAGSRATARCRCCPRGRRSRTGERRAGPPRASRQAQGRGRPVSLGAEVMTVVVGQHATIAPARMQKRLRRSLRTHGA